MAQYIRTLTFAVSADAVLPDTPQFGGVAGDDGVTLAVLRLDAALQGDGTRYRIQCTDGEGRVDTSDFLSLSDGALSLPLPRKWTAAGGVCMLQAVAEQWEGDALVRRAVSPPAAVYWMGSDGEAPLRREVGTLLADCHRAAQTAVDAADALQQAGERADKTYAEVFGGADEPLVLYAESSAVQRRIGYTVQYDGSMLASPSQQTFFYQSDIPFRVWLGNEYPHSYYAALAIYNGEADKANFVCRYRTDQGDMPLADTPLTVQAGQTLAFSFVSASTVPPKLYTDRTVGGSRIAALQRHADAETVQVQKTGEVITVTQGKSVYTLKRDISQSARLDTWRLTRQTVCGQEVWRDIDIEGPVKQQDTADFIGGYHGDERYTDVTVLADGRCLDMSADWAPMQTQRLTVLVHSEVYACGTDTVAFERDKRLDFTPCKLTVTNRWSYIGQQPFTVLTNCGGGMWSVFCDQISGYTADVSPRLHVGEGLAGGRQMRQVTVFGNGGFCATVRCLCETDEHYAADVSYFGSEARPRIKPYFMTVYNATPRTLQTGEQMYGCYEIEVR